MASLRIVRIAGIDIGIHPSWVVVFLLVTWSLAVAYFPLVVPGSAATHWILGAVASLLLFVSVILHELAHSIVAKRLGLDVRSITLFLFGGVSNLAGESPRPAVEFLIAVVGPLSSFVIAGLSALGALAAPAGSGIEAVLGYLAVINVLLGAFNLIPGFPLDGGRVLRSIVWQATGSLRRATDIAGTVGILVSYAFFIWGFVRALNGDLFGGLWIAAIGWFLQSAASASIQQTRMDESLRGTRVRDIVRPDELSVSPTLDVRRLVEEYLLPLNRRAMPVTDDGRVVGIVTLGDIKDVEPDRRAMTPVGDVMGGRDGVRVVRPDETLADALAALADGDYEQAPVVEDGRMVGMLNRADVLRQFQLRQQLHLAGRESSPEASGRLAGGPTAGVGR